MAALRPVSWQEWVIGGLPPTCGEEGQKAERHQ